MGGWGGWVGGGGGGRQGRPHPFPDPGEGLRGADWLHDRVHPRDTIWAGQGASQGSPLSPAAGPCPGLRAPASCCLPLPGWAHPPMKRDSVVVVVPA